LLLQHAKNKLGVRAMTLATASGLLVAGAGDELQRVAELGADVDAGQGVPEKIATWRLQVGTRVLLLTSLGGAIDPDLGPSIRRILAA
jgi:hypothetical protein